MTTGPHDPDEPIQHDRLADDADLLTKLEANARVRELLRDARLALAWLQEDGASDLELADVREKVAQLEEAVQRYS